MAGLPYTSLVPAMPLPTSSAWLNWFYGAPILGSQGLLQQRLQRVPRVRAITYFFSHSAGNDSNDGFDTVGFNLSGATYTASTQYIVSSGSFSSYTFVPGDLLYISAATGIATGLYKIAGPKIDNNTIQLLSTVDSVDGNLAAPATNATGISTSTGPWKTLAKMQTQLGTYTSQQSVNTRFRFRRNDIWTEVTTTTINVSNFTIDDYGIGEKPFWNAHGAKTTSGSWTLDTGNTWFKTLEANVISIRRKDARLTTVYRQVFNQGSDAANQTFVEATPYSWCINASNVVYINTPTNPNTGAENAAAIPFEYNLAKSGDGIDISDGNDNVRLMNFRMDGWGQNHTVHYYGIEAFSSNYGEYVIEGVEVYYTGYHAIGAIGTSSASYNMCVTHKDCTVGYTTYFNDGMGSSGESSYVYYNSANSSGSAGEIIYENCNIFAGSIPTDLQVYTIKYDGSTSTSVPSLVSNTCTGWITHTLGSLWALVIRSNCSYGHGAQTLFLPQGTPDQSGALPTATNATGGLAACRQIIIGEKCLGYPLSGSSWGFAGSGIAFINCRYEITPEQEVSQSIDGGSAAKSQGWFINSILSVDMRNAFGGNQSGFPQGAYFLFASSPGANIFHSFLEALYDHTSSGIGYSGPITGYLFNSIVSFRSGTDYNPFGTFNSNTLDITNNVANIGGNAYCGIGTYTGTHGFNNDPSLTIVSPNGLVEIPNVTTPYLNKGVSIPADAGGAIQVQYDINFNARPTTNPTPGPYEYVAYPSNLGGSGGGSDAGQRGNPFTNASVGGIIQDLA